VSPSAASGAYQDQYVFGVSKWAIARRSVSCPWDSTARAGQQVVSRCLVYVEEAETKRCRMRQVSEIGTLGQSMSVRSGVGEGAGWRYLSLDDSREGNAADNSHNRWLRMQAIRPLRLGLPIRAMGKGNRAWEAFENPLDRGEHRVWATHR